MATTTNYGWTTPDDTDLVKDGAAAIRTLGSSVDTTTKALNPSTTTGDIEYRSATANTNARLALGTAGQVLTVNSGATAPEWATAAPGGLNLISTTSTGGPVSSINFGSNASPIFSSTYDNYRITFVGTASTGLNPQMRMRADTTNATGANYDHQYLNATGTSALAARTTGATFNELPAVSTTAASFTIDLYSPFLTTATTYYSIGPSGISTISIQSFAGQHTLANSYNGFGILTGSAATIDGTFYIYGLAK
jgi:hypothetical protein